MFSRARLAADVAQRLENYPLIILAIDPGPFESGYVLFNPATNGIVDAGVRTNEPLLTKITDWAVEDRCVCAIEMVASYGMPVGAEVFDTVLWTGRFYQRWTEHGNNVPRLIYRKDVKLHLCGQTKGVNDSVIRQRLIDMLGPQGRKKAPGPTYGLTSHMWPALAVAVTAAQT